MKAVTDVIRTTAREFLDDDCMTMAAAISYYSVFALPPLLVLVLALVGLLVDPADAQGRISREVGALVGPDAAAMVGTMVREAGRVRSGPAAVVGIVALLFGATGAFMQLQKALNHAWDVPARERSTGLRGHVAKRVLSLGMILGIGFLLLVSMALTALLSAAGDALGAVLPSVVSGGLLRVIELSVSLVLLTVLFGALFKVLPDLALGWREVLVGAAFTAVLFSAGKFLLGYYLGRSDPGSAFGAAGALAAILVWIYYSSIILLLGAEFTQVWVRRRSEAGAPTVTPGSP
jgi:membrane protein